MANGTTAPLRLLPDPWPKDVSDPASAPAELAPAVVAAAAGYLSQGLIEYLNAGRMDPATKAAGGAAIAELVMVRLTMPDHAEFAAAVQREGFNWFQARDPVAVDAHRHGIGELLDHLVAIVERVARIESALSGPMQVARH